MDNYLQILQESLVKKLELLTAIEEKSKEQGQMIASEDTAMEALDANMEEKAALIDQITKLDTGFEALYDNIRKELIAHQEQYKKPIAKLQQLISEVMAKSASIEALEARNKTAIEEYFRRQRKELRHKKNASDAARYYYTAARKNDYVKPQFMDWKQ